jgi:hypothetical protein
MWNDDVEMNNINALTKFSESHLPCFAFHLSLFFFPVASTCSLSQRTGTTTDHLVHNERDGSIWDTPLTTYVLPESST